MTTHVFLGPTIPLTQAKEILADAYYHPPIQCGDLLRILNSNNQPCTILIIDGLFERSAAIWHKEILIALDQGYRVIGASSMGALRAAELNYFGMEGIGHIFQQFLSGQLEDDDEVAVLHAPEASNYLALSDALVNIRATISHAVDKKIISHETGNIIIDTAKSSFYPERTLKNICQHAKNKLGDVAEQFYKWATKNYVNQKYLDGIAALKHISKFEKSADITNILKKLATTTESSIFIRRLQRHASTTLQQTREECESSLNNSIQKFAKNHPNDFALLQETAYILACIYDLSIENVLPIKENSPLIEKLFSQYTAAKEFNRIYTFLNDTLTPYQSLSIELNKYQQWTKWLYPLDQCSHPITNIIIEQYSCLWLAINVMLKNRKVKIAAHELKQKIQKFHQHHRLNDFDNFKAWMEHFDEESFNEMVIAHAYLEVIKGGNYDFLGTCKNLQSINWLGNYYQLFYKKNHQTF